MKDNRTWILPATVLVYCLWVARDLGVSWVSAPLVRYHWIILIIWLIPVTYAFFRSLTQNVPLNPSYLLLGAAIAISTLGSLGELNALKHLGLAIGLAGLLPLSWPMFIWIPTAVSWLPAIGWFLRLLPRWGIFASSLALALIGTFCMLRFSEYFQRKGPNDQYR